MTISQTVKDRAVSAFVGAAAITSQMAILMNVNSLQELSVIAMAATVGISIGAGRVMTEKFNQKSFAVGMLGAAVVVGGAMAYVYGDEDQKLSDIDRQPLTQTAVIPTVN